MNSLSTKLGIFAAAIAVLALPAAAGAENLVPPDNSAVNQYTESFPTAGGDKDSEKAKGTGVTPAQTLGAKNAKRLEAHGEDGQRVAEVAAETAPAPVAATSPESAPAPAPEADAGKKKGSGNPDQPRPGEKPAPQEGAAGGGGGGSGSGGDGAAASGSSGAGEVLGQATGLSSGETGLLLPLVIFGSLACALAFLWRRRNQPTV